MNEVLEKIQKIGIVPVFAMEDFHVQRLLSVQMQQRSQSVSCLRNIQRCLLEPEQF